MSPSLQSQDWDLIVKSDINGVSSAPAHLASQAYVISHEPCRSRVLGSETQKPCQVLNMANMSTNVVPVSHADEETSQPTSSGRPTLPTAQSGGGKGR
ncbi:uncharacterized protein ARMOST_11307 [Armillaria ostoyae]|uniref:Uncharacterized protein n=1 Tax=Armillaria ostoyae TaxID=47428 RepID=A0A284RGT0_ARMOS|nr:uncharacterized protein ARMOST_11307 [Armillaria ostoyae]